MNSLPYGFKLPAHTHHSRPHQHSQSPQLCYRRLWPSQWQAASGAFPSQELCSSPIAPHQWWERFQSCFWQHLPVSAHWPRSTVLSGWQLGKSSGSSLSGHASYQLSQSNLGDICRSWFCDDASHQHYFRLPGLPVLADEAVAVTHVAPKFPGLPQSTWHIGGHDARGKPPQSLA